MGARSCRVSVRSEAEADTSGPGAVMMMSDGVAPFLETA